MWLLKKSKTFKTRGKFYYFLQVFYIAAFPLFFQQDMKLWTAGHKGSSPSQKSPVQKLPVQDISKTVFSTFLHTKISYRWALLRNHCRKAEQSQSYWVHLHGLLLQLRIRHWRLSSFFQPSSLRICQMHLQPLQGSPQDWVTQLLRRRPEACFLQLVLQCHRLCRWILKEQSRTVLLIEMQIDSPTSGVKLESFGTSSSSSSGLSDIDPTSKGGKPGVWSAWRKGLST